MVLTSACTGNVTCVHGKLVIFWQQKWNYALYTIWNATYTQYFSPWGKLQWGTKVLRHFRKMAPFCIVDIPIPFPCLPQPLPPKINVVFWTLKSFFYFRQHWFGGEGIYGVWKEWYNKWIKCLIKAPVLNKCVNYFSDMKLVKTSHHFEFSGREFQPIKLSRGTRHLTSEQSSEQFIVLLKLKSRF